MLKKYKRVLMNEKETYNAYVDYLSHPRRRAGFIGHYYQAACFSCPKKQNEVLNSYYMRTMDLPGDEKLDLRACKVCVKYAMRLSELRQKLTRLERFFQPLK